MVEVEQRSWWKRRFTMHPGMATLLGIVGGSAIPIVCMFPPAVSPVSLSRAALLFLGCMLVGAGYGYVFWLKGQPARCERLFAVSGQITLIAIVLLLLLFPSFWRLAATEGGLFLVLFLLGGICPLTIGVVGVGWALAHGIGDVRQQSGRTWKSKLGVLSDALWDRDVDHDHPSVRPGA